MSSLDFPSHQVMQALSVYGKPVNKEALYYLLKPYAEDLRLEEVLRNLSRSFFIKTHRATGKIAIHPLDIEYNYYQIPDCDKRTLELRAAAFYRQFESSCDNWRTIDDLEPQLLEFEHLVKGKSYNKAAQLVNKIDTDYLSLWGYQRSVLNMREALLNNISDRKLESQNLIYLGIVKTTLSYYEEAIEIFSLAREINGGINDIPTEALILSSMGLAYHNQAKYEIANEYFEKALDIAYEINDEKNLSKYLCYIGSGYRHLGRLDFAIERLKEALKLARKFQNKQIEGRESSIGFY